MIRPGGAEFQKRYRAELRQNKGVVDELRQKCRDGVATFVYAVRDEQHNGAPRAESLSRTPPFLIHRATPRPYRLVREGHEEQTTPGLPRRIA